MFNDNQVDHESKRLIKLKKHMIKSLKGMHKLKVGGKVIAEDRSPYV
jgi:hypothetical protein